VNGFSRYVKNPDETYTLLSSKLRNTLMYYSRRNITDEFDKLVSLLCADRLKELIPKSCLEFILAQEKDGWLKHDELAHSIDIYMSSHDVDGNPCRTGGSAFKRDNRGPKDSKSSESSHVSKMGTKGKLS
jgi:hypothetical protein